MEEKPNDLRQELEKLRRRTAELAESERELQQVRDRLKESEERYRIVTETAQDAIITIDEQSRMTLVNPAAERMFGYTGAEMYGRPLTMLMPEPLKERYIDAVTRYLATGRKNVPWVSIEFSGQRKDGVEIPLEISFGDFVKDGKHFFTGIIRDVTERKRMEEKIRHQALHDELTGLANRSLFTDHFRVELAKARRNNRKIALLFLDIDRFKVINDTLGHDAGDELLRQVAGRLKQSIRESDTVARIGGDEFTVLVGEISRSEDAMVIIKKIYGFFEQPFLIKEQELHVTTSTGVSIYPEDGQEIDSLLRYADIAMYHAKEKGRNNYQFYSSTINSMTLERLRLENQLRQAAERGELVLYYQPQIDMDTGRLTCTEAFLRWQHPELGLLRPEQFMRLAEETGLIIPIGEWTLRTACQQNMAWQTAGYPPVCITVNLSTRQFHQPDLFEKILRILEEVGLGPEWLELEIKETTAMQDIDFALSSMKRLAQKGVKFSLDDFGTGCSSLNSLRRLPIQKLKIDRSFIERIPHDPDHRAIVRAVIAMSHSLRLKTIAVGVQTHEQMSFLRSNHCDEMQGYLMHEPVPQEKYTEVITAHA